MTQKEREEFEMIKMTDEELCVGAAFLKVPFLYGVSSQWMFVGYGTLSNKIKRIVRKLESDGTILMKPDGNLMMRKELYNTLTLMKNSNRVARIAYGEENGEGRIFFYYVNDEVAFLKKDILGNDECGNIKQFDYFQKCMSLLCGEQSKMRWMTFLVLEKENELYMALYDAAWKKGNDSLSDIWNQFCKNLFNGRE